jgi:hypothetical protein
MRNSLKEGDWGLLLERIKDGKCTPFLGAGACAGTLPLGAEVAKEWAEKYAYPLEDSSDLARVAEYLAVTKDPMSPKEEIAKRFRNIRAPDFKEPAEPHGVLADLPLPVYMTTNYDNFMAQALTSRNRDPKWEFCRWNRLVKKPPSIFESGSGFDPTPANPVVFHLHGHVEVPESLVLTEDDYLDFLKNLSENQRLLPARIQRALTGTSLLFLGYRIADWDFRVIFRILVSYLEKSIGRAHMSVQLVPVGDEARRGKAQEYLNQYFGELKIRMYWGTCSDFADELRSRWEVFNRGH